MPPRRGRSGGRSEEKLAHPQGLVHPWQRPRAGHRIPRQRSRRSPSALPANADGQEQTFQPAYDYDTDGCYPTPAIGPDGTVNPGLNPSGALNGQCRDSWDLDNTNGYSRSKCNNGWCAIMYGLYFEKDQAVVGSSLGGHRHDWEHVVVWVQNDQAQYVSTSAHGNFDIHSRDQIRWDGTHPKVVYHKDGIGTHAFRAANSNDEPPENHHGDGSSRSWSAGTDTRTVCATG